jgi:hypothetical protein
VALIQILVLTNPLPSLGRFLPDRGRVLVSENENENEKKNEKMTNLRDETPVSRGNDSI